MIIPTSSYTALKDSWGGFDLDDHLIKNLHYIKDTEGNRRLASYVWRQPTGPQEAALMLPYLDDETLQVMLGGSDQAGSNIFADKFRRAASAAAEALQEQKLNRLPTRALAMTADELDQFSRVEKILLYLASIANGRMENAKSLKPLDVSMEEVERMIFRVLDIGQNMTKKAEGDFGGLILNVQDNTTEGAQISYAKILRKLNLKQLTEKDGGLNQAMRMFQGITEVPEAAMRAFASGGFGAIMQLSQEQAMALIAESPDLKLQYRDSSLYRLFATNLEKATGTQEERLFSRTIQNIYESLPAEFTQELGGSYSRALKAAGRNLGETEQSFAVARNIILHAKKIGDVAVESAVMQAFDKMYNQGMFLSLNQEDALSKFINKLGFASSFESQRQEVITGLKKAIADDVSGPIARYIKGDEKLLEKIQEVFDFKIAAFDPEKVVDAALGASGRLTFDSGDGYMGLYRSLLAHQRKSIKSF